MKVERRLRALRGGERRGKVSLRGPCISLTAASSWVNRATTMTALLCADSSFESPSPAPKFNCGRQAAGPSPSAIAHFPYGSRGLFLEGPPPPKGCVSLFRHRWRPFTFSGVMCWSPFFIWKIHVLQSLWLNVWGHVGVELVDVCTSRV